MKLAELVFIWRGGVTSGAVSGLVWDPGTESRVKVWFLFSLSAGLGLSVVWIEVGAPVWAGVVAARLVELCGVKLGVMIKFDVTGVPLMWNSLFCFNLSLLFIEFVAGAGGFGSDMIF